MKYSQCCDKRSNIKDKNEINSELVLSAVVAVFLLQKQEHRIEIYANDAKIVSSPAKLTSLSILPEDLYASSLSSTSAMKSCFGVHPSTRFALSEDAKK